jgi:DNA polymerase V
MVRLALTPESPKGEHDMSASTNDNRMLPIHIALGMTPEQVDEDLRANGYDPEAVVASMVRLGKTLSAQFADVVLAERMMESQLSTALPHYSESVAAGSPEWTGPADPPRRSTALGLLGNPNPLKCIWVNVRGWSMRDEGIKDGDTVLVDTSIEAKDGDIVIAHIAGEGQVIKRLRIQPGKPIVLESANPDFPPRVIDDPSSLRVHGVVTHRFGKA